MTTKPIPDGYHTLTPSFTFKNSKQAIEFYTKAFCNSKVVDFLPTPDGQGTMHATLQIGNSIFMMGDEMPGAGSCKSAETLGVSPISFYVYVTDVDTDYKRALAAGGVEVMPVADMFWGDRCGTFKDPFGYTWTLATHKQDLNMNEIAKRAEVFLAEIPPNKN